MITKGKVATELMHVADTQLAEGIKLIQTAVGTLLLVEPQTRAWTRYNTADIVQQLRELADYVDTVGKDT